MNKNQSTLKSRMKYFESLIGDVPVNVDTTDNFLKPSKRKKARRINMDKSNESFSRRRGAVRETRFSLEETVRVVKPDERSLRSKTTMAPEWAKLSLASIPPNRSLAKTKKS